MIWIGGAPSSRFSQPAPTVRARMITVERPGYGISTPQRGRRIADFARDVRVVLDALGLERVTVMGYSGGGPYALACAHALPDRIERAVVIGGVGPLDDDSPIGLRRRAILRLSGLLPVVGRVLLRLRDPRRDIERFYRSMIRDLSPHDLEVVGRPGPWQRQIRQTREAFAQGPDALIEDLALYARPWGFRLEDIRVPVELWYGEDDRSTPAATATQLKRRVPHARVHLLPGEGHFLVFDEERGGLQRVLDAMQRVSQA